MQELAFAGLLAAAGLATAALIYSVVAVFRAKEEDEFYASSQASTERYQKRYKGNWVARGSARPQPSAKESADPDERAQWLRDLEEGDGFDKRFWDPDA
jgi:hypothetical protein